jgi:hypothetical protein
LSDPLGFDELVDLLRMRLHDADAVEPSRIHSFKELMSDQAQFIADNWYWEALEELQAQGHLDESSHKVSGGDACGRLSADGRFHARSTGHNPGTNG